MTWGLALSGGAAYGIANAGVIRALERNSLRPDYIAGSSMGAIVGALYAFTQDADVFDAGIRDLKLHTIAQPSARLLQDGLHGGILRQRMTKYVQPIVGDATIADCSIPFCCIAGRIEQPITWQKILTEKTFTDHVLDCVTPVILPPETRIIDALMATSAIPVLFSPVRIDEEEYIDLCQFGAIPARSVRQAFAPDSVIGTDTTPEYKTILRLLPPGWSTFLQTGEEEKQRSIDACDIVIGVPPAAPIYRFDRAEAFIDAGKKAAQEKIGEIRRCLEEQGK